MSHQDNFETQGARFGGSIPEREVWKVCERLLKERDEARLEAKAYREVAIKNTVVVEVTTDASGGKVFNTCKQDNVPNIVSAEKQRLLDEWKKAKRSV